MACVEAFERGDDPAGWVGAITDEMAETFVILGTPDECRKRVEEVWDVADSFCLVRPDRRARPRRRSCSTSAGSPKRSTARGPRRLRVAVLCGGFGAARFLDGLRRVPGLALTCIANTADDLDYAGVHVSPDVDTVSYALAGLFDETRGFGMIGDTFRNAEALRRYGLGWFAVGDVDLATSLRRTDLLRAGATLSEATADLARGLGLAAAVVPDERRSRPHEGGDRRRPPGLPGVPGGAPGRSRRCWRWSTTGWTRPSRRRPCCRRWRRPTW